MRFILILAMAFFTASAADTDELAHILVQEWGVITISSGVPIVTSSPDEADMEQVDDQGFAVRAPVLYFSGPEFTGTVTVETDNGAIFDIYPAVPDCDRTHSSVSWTAEFSFDRIESYPESRGLAAGEWNFDNWRVSSANTVSIGNNWQDKFLYYETAPSTIDFLPYLAGAESVADEYGDLEALVFKSSPYGMRFSRTNLRTLVYGGEMDYSEAIHEDVMRVIFDWSVDILEPDQTEALWRTWAGWLLEGHAYQSGYENGMILYLVPQELTERISTITVEPAETDFPVDVQRYILMAVPL